MPTLLDLTHSSTLSPRHASFDGLLYGEFELVPEEEGQSSSTLRFLEVSSLCFVVSMNFISLLWPRNSRGVALGGEIF